MPSLCELLASYVSPACPGLPGDPPFEETFAFLSLIALGLSLLIAGVLFVFRRGGHRLVRLCARWGVVSVLMFAFCALRIRERNHGRWAGLKQQLTEFAEDARLYEAGHKQRPGSPEWIEEFYESERLKGRTRTFAFGPSGPEVHIQLRGWNEPLRPTIVWGNGGSAQFDLDTMICTNSD